jgi:23S rRNA pseudouridine1911/1915/1917 synthase
MLVMRVPSGSSRTAETGTGNVGTDTTDADHRRAIPTTNPVVPSTINTAITTTTTFNARMPSPIRTQAALFHSQMPTNSEPAEPIRITATEADNGERIDRFLADTLGTLSRSRIKALIEEGRLRGPEGPVSQPSDPARAGVTYTLHMPAPLLATPQPQAIPFPILYEDEDLIVLDKPAGLVVHPAPGNLDGTLVNALLAHCGPEFTGIGAERRPGIVHRLDKDTSGVMVVAKTQQANDALTAAFAARDLDRAYLALVWGLPQPLFGEIEGAIGRDKRDRKRMAMVDRGGKFALTRYRTMRAWQTSLALVECRLATGRTHQIRVHFAAKGHPIIGDPLYLRRVPSLAKAIIQPLRGQLLDFPRQALHAASLAFKHPRTGRRMAFEAALPSDMQALLQDVEATLDRS